jgi:rubrerythrin
LAAIAQKKELKEMFLKLAQEEAEHRLQFEFQYDLATFQKRDKKR